MALTRNGSSLFKKKKETGAATNSRMDKRAYTVAPLGETTSARKLKISNSAVQKKWGKVK
jgi:hypothetical protein